MWARFWGWPHNPGERVLGCGDLTAVGSVARFVDPWRGKIWSWSGCFACVRVISSIWYVEGGGVGH